MRDAEAVQLVLDLVLVAHGLGRVEHDEDEVARTRRADDLPTATLAVAGALNDTGQIQDLDLRATVHQRTRYRYIQRRKSGSRTENRVIALVMNPMTRVTFLKL